MRKLSNFRAFKFKFMILNYIIKSSFIYNVSYYIVMKLNTLWFGLK